MILNPNCSEIVVSINTRNEKEVFEVIKDMMKALDSKLYISIAEYSNTHLLKEKDKLIFLTKPFGADKKLNDFIEKNKLPKVEFDLEIPMDLIYLKTETKKANDKTYKITTIKIDDKIQDMVFKSIKLKIQGKQETIKNTKVDISKIGYLRLRIGNLKLSNTLGSMYSPFKGNSIDIENDAYDSEYFPSYKKVLDMVSDKFKVKVLGGDGGSTRQFEEWCKLNFLDYIINSDKYTDFTYFKCIVYLLDCKDLQDFKVFLKDLEKIGISLVKDSRHKINPLEIKNITIGEKIELILPDKRVALQYFTLEPFDANLLETSFHIGVYTIGIPYTNIKTRIYYILQEGKPKNDNTKSLKLIKYLEKHAKKTIKV